MSILVDKQKWIKSSIAFIFYGIKNQYSVKLSLTNNFYIEYWYEVWRTNNKDPLLDFGALLC